MMGAMNWQSIISDLKTRQVTQNQIAALCDCKQSSVSDLATGKTKQPGFQLGHALMSLRGTNDRELKRLLASLKVKATA